MDDLGVPLFQETSKWQLKENYSSFVLLQIVSMFLGKLWFEAVWSSNVSAPLRNAYPNAGQPSVSDAGLTSVLLGYLGRLLK